jgi:hypothetical protein
MPQLKDKNRQIPGGLICPIPALGFNPPKYASFTRICDLVEAAFKGNPSIVQKHGWSTDRKWIEDYVEDINAKHCEALGWSDYITTGGGQSSVPFQNRSNPFGQLPGVAAGAKILVEWIASGEEAVPIDVSESRAAICADCPKNEKGDWTRFFTVPVSNEIKKQLEKRRGWNLKTSHDEKLNICGVCLCPIKLKVHVPLDRILKNLDPEVRANLHPKCWIK